MYLYSYLLHCWGFAGTRVSFFFLSAYLSDVAAFGRVGVVFAPTFFFPLHSFSEIHVALAVRGLSSSLARRALVLGHGIKFKDYIYTSII